MPPHEMLKQTLRNLGSFKLYEEDLGVELEIEGINLPMELEGWVVKKENSLRGEAYEYTTKGAVSLNTLEHQMRHLNRYMTRQGTKVIFSNRESTHIHLNMQHHSFVNIFGFILLFTIIEPVFMRLAGNDRNGNLFCLPAYETGDLPRFIRGLCSSIKRGGLGFANRGKYANLNLDCLQTFGTVEVRSLPLSIEVDKILQWSNWILNIRRMAVDWPDSTFTTLFEYCGTEQNRVLNDIFTGPLSPPLFTQLHPTNISELIQLGIETSYEVHREMIGMLDYKKQKNEKPVKVKKIQGYSPQDMAGLGVEQMAIYQNQVFTAEHLQPTGAFYPEPPEPPDPDDIEQL